MLISILACSLGFHAITFERSTFTKIAIFKNQASVALNPLVSLFGRLVARDAITSLLPGGLPVRVRDSARAAIISVVIPRTYRIYAFCGLPCRPMCEGNGCMAGRALRCERSKRVSRYGPRRYAATSHHIPRSSQQQLSCSTLALRIHTVSRLQKRQTRVLSRKDTRQRSQWVSTSAPLVVCARGYCVGVRG